jgi:hypothetical protein
VAAWSGRPFSRPGRLFLAASAAIVLGFQLVNGLLYLGPRPIYRESDPVFRSTVARLSADPCFARARLFVWGWAPPFYYYAGLHGVRPASRFAVMAQSGLTTYVPGNIGGHERGEEERGPSPRHWDWLMEDLEASRPAFILDTAPAAIYRWNRYPLRDYPRLDRYVKESYEVLDDVGDVLIYRRRDCGTVR